MANWTWSSLLARKALDWFKWEDGSWVLTDKEQPKWLEELLAVRRQGMTCDNIGCALYLLAEHKDVLENLSEKLVEITGEMTVLVADEENNAEEWWSEALDNADSAPECIKDWLQNATNAILLTPAEAEEVRKWAESLPGWDDGPAHAPYPLLFHEY